MTNRTKVIITIVSSICAFFIIFALLNQYKGNVDDKQIAMNEQKNKHEDTTEDKNTTKDADTTNYEGIGAGFKGDIKVLVGLSNDKITNIKVVEYKDDEKWFLRAKEQIIPDILEAQSTDVDVVSGATFSSKGIIEAVNDALGKAGK